MISRITLVTRLVSLCTFLCVVIGCSSLYGLIARWRLLSKEELGHAGSFKSILFFDEQNGVALNALGLAQTTDGGRSWSWLLDSGNRGFYSMRFIDRQEGWIVGAQHATDEERPAMTVRRSPLILRTEDGGITWRNIDLDQFVGTAATKFSAFHSICTERSGTVWLAGDAGIVEATIEADELRVSNVTNTPAAVNDLSCDDFGKVWAVGNNGLIMNYADKQWVSIESRDTSAFYNKVKVKGNVIWLVGGTRAKESNMVKGLVLNSVNGSKWEDRTPPDAGLLFDLAVAENEGWLIGARGSIYHTNDNGVTWLKEISPTQNDLVSVFVLNDERAWIGGDKLCVLGLKPK